jgi:hypothetical protein
MIFLCSLVTVLTGYVLAHQAPGHYVGLKERLLGDSYRISVVISVVKGLIVAFLLLVHLDVFLQLGYSKALVHSALSISS